MISSTCIDVATISQRHRYSLLIGAIVPRPIAVVGSISPTGALNLAPFSFYNGVGSEPMLLSFCPANRADGTHKDTLRNVLPERDGGMGCFSVSVVSQPILRQIVAAGEELDYGVSEFAAVGLSPITGTHIKAPRIAEALITFECVTEIVHEFARGIAGGANMVIGRVIAVHIADALANERMNIDASTLDAVGRMGGRDYCTTHERFTLPMGLAALHARE